MVSPIRIPVDSALWTKACKTDKTRGMKMSRKFTDFEIRMKEYESHFTSLRCMKNLPVFCRIDGKAFHTWTRDLKRPYDERLSELFIETTKFLMEETGAKIGYTQSDEITLCWYYEDYKSEMFFDGKCHKLNSVVASLATGFFNDRVIHDIHLQYMPIPINENISRRRPLAFFDCRTWQVPNLDEAANVFLWREQDATRNSISMAAQSLYSHKELHEKNTKQMQEMIFKKGINWNDYPSFFKKGTYLVRSNIRSTEVSTETIKDETCNRREIKEFEIPPLKSLENRVGVLFKGEKPIIKQIKTMTEEQREIVEHETSIIIGQLLSEEDEKK